MKSKSLEKAYELLLDCEKKISKERNFHVAIARLMELYNMMSQEISIQKELYKYLLISLYPFVPHLTSELWEKHSEFLGARTIEEAQKPDY